MTINVCDMIMGAGKTESAITQMKRDTDSRYIFITPYIDVVERIKASCEERCFRDPKNYGDGKLESLHEMLADGCNIASTHALFHRYNDTTIRLIREGGYRLILDEVTEVYEHIPLSTHDVAMLIDEHIISVDDQGRVTLERQDYEGKFDDLRDMVLTGHVTLYKNCLMLWTFPIEVFEAFRDVTILTYLFDAQVQKYYFDINGVEIRRIGTVYERGEYHFCELPRLPDYVRTLRDRVHVLQDGKLNEIGEVKGSLSVSWYDRARKAKGQPLIRQMRNNLVNVFINKYGSATNQNLWTTFKDCRELLKGKGYTKGFLSWNARATNAYRDRDHLAFCVNIYYNPLMKGFFLDHGIEVQEDRYALGEMIQWIWRSAVRDGGEIWVYVPSKRMRELLTDWLDEMAAA